MVMTRIHLSAKMPKEQKRGLIREDPKGCHLSGPLNKQLDIRQTNPGIFFLIGSQAYFNTPTPLTSKKNVSVHYKPFPRNSSNSLFVLLEGQKGGRGWKGRGDNQSQAPIPKPTCFQYVSMLRFPHSDDVAYIAHCYPFRQSLGSGFRLPDPTREKQTKYESDPQEKKIDPNPT